MSKVTNNLSQFNIADDFSLVLGGPLFQLFIRARLTTDTLGLVKRRLIFFSLFTWLPLLVLSVLAGEALGGAIKVPFIYDVDVHVRFLLALPLLLVAELVVHQRIRLIVRQFIERGIIPAASPPGVRSPYRLCDAFAQFGGDRGIADCPGIDGYALSLVKSDGAGIGHLVCGHRGWASPDIHRQGIGTPLSAFRFINSLLIAGFFAFSSGRGFCGRFPDWICISCRRIPTALRDSVFLGEARLHLCRYCCLKALCWQA